MSKKEKILKNLPKDVVITHEDIPDELAEKLTEWVNEFIAEKYGYCNKGYSWDLTMTAYNVDWDLDDIEED